MKVGELFAVMQGQSKYQFAEDDRALCKADFWKKYRMTRWEEEVKGVHLGVRVTPTEAGHDGCVVCTIYTK